MIRMRKGLLGAARERPLAASLCALCVLVCALVVAGPLALVRYPPMTDLPFHAAQTATLRHYWDPAFHFQEQFELRPLAVPYLSMYVLGALLMLVMSPLAAVKVAAAVMLGLLPAGLAVLCHGMKKSPLLGALGLLVVWTPLTHWAFLNFLGALGLFAMALGFTMIVAERPSRGARAGLALSLVAIFFTHIYRYPITLIGVLGTVVVLWPPRARLWALLSPLLPSLALFAAWWKLRPASLSNPLEIEGLHTERLAEIPGWHIGAFRGSGEQTSWELAGLAVLAFLAVCAAARLRGGARAPSPDRAFRVRATVVVVGGALGSLVLYLALPMWIGDWWYVYPREATAVLFFALAALPDLPRSPAPRALAAAFAMLAPLPMAITVASSYASFDAATADFDAIKEQIPAAPKLLYLIYDHTGSTRTVSPFTHLPAYVQAEKGGWLSYHFEKYGASPLAYYPREGRESVIPPPTPPNWEVRPDLFDVRDRGQFFDWFLVRSPNDPAIVFAADPAVVPFARRGEWWLYRRAPESR